MPRNALSRADSLPDLVNSLLKAKRSAMLVIHGIGEQNPYETLDNFARNLASFFMERCNYRVVISPEKIAHDDWVEVCIQLTFPDRGPDGGKGEIDLYEYYWASQTEGKITYRETLAWLIKTDLSPIQHFGDNLQLEQSAAEASKNDPRILPQKPRQVFRREILRILGIYLPVLVALIGLAFWLTAGSDWSGFWAKVSAALKGRDGFIEVSVTAFVGMAALMAFIVASTLWERFHRTFKSTSPKGDAFGTVLASASIVFFLTLAWLVADLGKIGWQNYWRSIIWQPATLKAMLVLGVASVLRYFLRAYVGDVAIYVNADAKAKNYEARVRILNDSTLALTRILKDKQRNYDQVIVAGHSLGSVIAYDTIDELLNESAAEEDQLNPQGPRPRVRREDLEKLTGLVTFGSPLDKVYYFFREHVPSDQAIRAQILSYLHSFRKIGSGRDYDGFQFQHYDVLEPSRLRWLNAWSNMDIVSGRLHFYKVDERKQFHYWQPILAHLTYWGDPEFYEFIATRLLLTAERAPSTVKETAAIADAKAAAQ